MNNCCEHPVIEIIGIHKDYLQGEMTPLYRCLECKGVIEVETIERYRKNDGLWISVA